MKKNHRFSAAAILPLLIALGCSPPEDDGSGPPADAHATSDGIIIMDGAMDTASYGDATGDPTWDSARAEGAAYDSPPESATSAESSPEDAPPDPTAPDAPADDAAARDAGPDAESDASSADTAPDGEPPTPPDDVCLLDLTGPQVLYLSADDSNSEASPVIARSLIHRGKIVPDRVVRTYEFLNYYAFSYPPPGAGGVRVVIQASEEPGPSAHYDLQIGVQSGTLTMEDERHVNLTFVLDTSGSMRDAPIELLKEVCRQAASRLRGGDVVSVLTWNTERIHVLDAYEVEGPSDPVVLEAVDSLRAEGRTDLHSGLVEGYAIAEAHYHEGWLNRVILVSDGEANVGVTDESVIAREADDSEREGIYIVGVGVGEGYNDTLMNAVTDAGKGAYVFIDSPEEARKMFRQRFLQTLEIAVMDVQVELTLPPVLRMEVFHGEEVSGDPKEVEPQHLAPNDAMIFHMKLRGCGEPAAADIVTAVAWYTDPATKHRLSSSAAFNLPYLLELGGWQMAKGNAVVAYAEGLKRVYLAYMEGGAAAAALPCAETIAAVEEGLEAIRDPELLEIQSLLDDYCRTLASRTLPDLF